MSQQFESPASSSGINWNDYNGALLIFEVKEVVHGITTSYGERDAVRADVYVVDSDHASNQPRDTLIFPAVLQSQLSSKVGKMVLGRLGQGQAKPGQSPPWLLEEARAGDNDKATEYLAKRTTSQLSGPDVI
jgi:hypothetical protein